MAEAIARDLGGPRVEPFSAGSHPAGYIHPLAEATMQSMGISIAGQFSKSWDMFEDQEIDVIITLCDHAADQPCPAWPGRPATAHWGFADPAALDAPEPERLAFARHVAETLKTSIQGLLDLDRSGLSPEELQRRVQDLGPNDESR
jgi:arsenate reductase